MSIPGLILTWYYNYVGCPTPPGVTLGSCWGVDFLQQYRLSMLQWMLPYAHAHLGIPNWIQLSWKKRGSWGGGVSTKIWRRGDLNTLPSDMKLSKNKQNGQRAVALPVQFPEPTSVCNFSSRGSNTLLWPPWAPSIHTVHIYTCM